MNLEIVKTVILTILVLLSILLTFGLWNYKPDVDRLYNAPDDYINEVDLGGKEITKKEVVQPRLIMFHKDEGYFGFTNIKEQQSLYKDMQEWMLYDFQTSKVTLKPKKHNKVEVIFPTAIPLEMIKTLFTFHEEPTSEAPLPSWSFKQMFIIFNEEQSTLTVQFQSIDGREQSSATVNNSSIYNNLMQYISTDESLVKYVTLEKNDTPIYMPAVSVEMIRRSLAIENIEPSLLVDALFTNPALVSHNIRESSFSDGQRALSVLQEGRSMEYYNPIESSYNQIEPIELLDKSIANINDHKGWTEEYHLADIDQLKSKVQYRMHYGGYPIYNSADLSIIEQQWRDQDLHLYRRHLFSLNDSLGGDIIKLHSGTEVIHYLENNDNFDINKITDIQIGYKLIYPEDVSYSIVLEPAWHMNYDNNWLEIRFDELEKHDKGGS